MTDPPDAEFEADLINGRACASCGVRITPENRVRRGGFWICRPGCANESSLLPSPAHPLTPPADARSTPYALREKTK